VIRAARAEDAGAIAAIYAAEVLGGVATFETEPPGVAAMAERMGAARWPWLVATEAGAVLGYAYAGPYNSRAAYRWTAETTVYVAADARGHGVGGALYAALIERLTRAGLAQAIALVSAGNAGSERLHEAAGFRRVGTLERVGWKLGRWIDVGLWQRALAEPGSPPREPGAG
jgi:phosphinothricin acetyltransferase